MATNTSISSTEMSHTPFSYAQAAKGQIVAQPAPQPTTSPAPPSVSSQGKDDATTASTAATALTTASGDNEVFDSGKQPRAEEEPGFQKQDSETSSREADVESHSATDTTSPPLVNGEAVQADARQVAAEDKAHRSSSRTSGSTDGEARKGRKGKKARHPEKDGDADKGQEEEKEPPKPVTLSEAPIPSVNPWFKRIEAQAAKSKVATTASSQSAAPAQAAQVDDSKKRTASGEADIQAGAPSGANGEKAPQRKSADYSRIAEQIPRRNGPRGSRMVEKDEKAGAEPLPPVADATLWPDVKSAVAADEGKKKPQEKTDRAEKEGQDETGPSKRSKKEWVAIPYVPTVNFQTPMPQRGSRPRGGARGGREAGSTRGAHGNTANVNAASATSPTSEKPPTTSTAGTKETRPREGSGLARANSLPLNSSKRASIDSSLGREQRKPSAPAVTDRSRDPAAENSYSTGAKAENGRMGRADFNNPSSEQQQSHFGSRNFSERRGEAGFKGYDVFKEPGIPTPKEQGFATRDRAEGPGRGRGGYRARGGQHASVGGHQQATYSANGQYPGHPVSGRPNGPYSPPAHQNVFGSTYVGSSTRGAGRGTGRGSSGPTGYGRGMSNGAVPAKMAQVNTVTASYDYQMQQYAPYPPIVPPMYDGQVVQLLTLQVEYYFSVDNLCKDYWLRKHMDSQGFVPFDLITGFNRVKGIAPDVEHIRAACEFSDKMDYVVGEDGIERLRVRDMWERFVLPMEEREEVARNEGPSQTWPRSRHSSRLPYTAQMLPVAYHATSPSVFQGGFPSEEQMYQQPYLNGAPYEPGIKGGDLNDHRYAAESQLSATVPEFSPNIKAEPFAPEPFTMEGATTFSDEEVEKLMVMVTDDKKDSSSSPSQAQAAVANGTCPPSERPRTNGVTQDPGSSNATGTQSPSGAPKNVVWVDGDEPINLNSQPRQERYVDLRQKALEERQIANAGETPGHMKALYKVWSHVLVHSFNPKMYEEFYRCAMEDATKNPSALVGLKHLLRYYEKLRNGNQQKPWGNDRPIPEIFNLHYGTALEVDRLHSANGETRI